MEAPEEAQRTTSGDLSAFESLYEEHVALVYGIAMRVLRDPTRAEDVTQSVFVKVLKAPEAFRAGNFAGWIARVARNCAVDELRRNSRMAPLMDFAIDCDGALHPDDIAVTLADARRAREVMAALPAPQREALELAFFEGLSHQEISAKTGVPLGTVKTRIRTALATIRKQLQAGPVI